jgi:hypothetical protein
MSSTNASLNVNAHRQPRVLACVLCQHRKIKCDRNTPCSNCVKANVTCTPSTPAPARKRRRPNHDLQERLARCEQLLKQYAGGAVPSVGEVQAATASTSTPSPSTAAVRAEIPDLSPGGTEVPDKSIAGHPGIMIKQEGSARFTDSQLWTKFYDEVGSLPQWPPRWLRNMCRDLS